MPTSIQRTKPPITVKTLLITALGSAREIRLGWDVRTVALLVIGVCMGCAAVLYDNPAYLTTSIRLKELENQAAGYLWFVAFVFVALSNLMGILFGTEPCPSGKINPLMASHFAVRFWLVFRSVIWFLTSFLFWLVAKLMAQKGIGWGSIFTGFFGFACTINLKVVGQELLYEIVSSLDYRRYQNQKQICPPSAPLAPMK